MILEKKYASQILGVLILLLIPFIYLLIFTHPIADDLAFGHQAKTTNLLSQLQTTYLNWNGRYSGNFFIQLFPISIDNLLFYRLLLFVSFGLFVVSFYMFIKSIFSKTTLVTLWSITLLGVLAYLSILPTLAEGFYWYTSVIYYQLSLVFFLFFSAFAINFVRQQFLIHKVFHLGLTIFLLIIAIGMNESVALIIPFVCTSFFVGSLIIKSKNSTFLAVLTIVAIGCAAVVVFSPGNEIRMATYANNKDLVTSLFMSFLQMGRFLAGFIFSFSGLFYFLFVACFFPLSTTILKQLKPHYLFIGFVAILFLSVFPAYYATGILGQHRTLNIAALFYILFITLFALKIGNKLKERLPRKPQKMIVYFTLFFFIFGNGRTVVLGLISGKIQEYDKQLQQRYIALKENRSGKINQLTVHPKSIYVIDVETDSTHWVNQAYLLENNN
ncbi:MAG: hypothetical protein H6587_07385 [Flavobacteriales bacterium]|nr:hypothetical protein [Flavobacteriales bacterium]MCB9364373.1 hypothetical protein [Flavobacteriales bacterium]